MSKAALEMTAQLSFREMTLHLQPVNHDLLLLTSKFK